MPEKPPVDSDGEIIGDLPWKFFERDTPGGRVSTDPGAGLAMKEGDKWMERTR